MRRKQNGQFCASEISVLCHQQRDDRLQLVISVHGNQQQILGGLLILKHRVARIHNVNMEIPERRMVMYLIRACRLAKSCLSRLQDSTNPEGRLSIESRKNGPVQRGMAHGGTTLGR